jgi:hypothetical protein
MSELCLSCQTLSAFDLLLRRRRSLSSDIEYTLPLKKQGFWHKASHESRGETKLVRMSCAVNEPRNDKSHGRCRGSFCSLPAGYPVSPLGEQALQLVEKWNWLADMLGKRRKFSGPGACPPHVSTGRRHTIAKKPPNTQSRGCYLRPANYRWPAERRRVALFDSAIAPVSVLTANASSAAAAQPAESAMTTAASGIC